MIEKLTLKNGIPVFIVETHASPVVSIQAWVKRGSAYEEPKVAGISHFLEHALFKGTKRRKVGEIANQIEARGGEVNAFTSFEETAYYTTLASRYFEDGIDILADALQNPLFDAEEMEKEKEVILEEIKRANDSPGKTLSQNLWKTLFDGTPYGRPVLGFVDTVSKINSKTLRSYFNQHYHAGTTSVFIVGDVDTDKAFDLVQKKFGKMKGGKKTEIKPFKIIPPRNPRLTFASRDVKECQVQLAWHAPEVTHPSIAALDIFCSSIGSGESSRLYQRLVKETKLCTDVSMGLVAMAHCGLGAMSFEVSPEHVETTIKECIDVVENAVLNGIKEREIERVKTSTESDVVAGKETVEGYARRLGYYHIQFGDPDYEKKYLEALLSTERQDAVEAAAKMLSQKPSVSIVHPKDCKLDHKSISTALNRTTKRKYHPVGEIAALRLNKQGNIRFVEKVVTSLPTVAMKIIFPGGSVDEAPGQLGLGNLFQRVWTSGTKSYSSLDITHTLESLGASIYSFSGKHTTGLSIEFLSKHWKSVKPLLSEILLAPTFPKDEIETERGILLREIQMEKDSPGSLCSQNFYKALYGDHAYGRSSLGSYNDVKNFTQYDLQQRYRDYIHQKNVVVSTVGNFDSETLETEMHEILKGLPESGRTVKPASKVPSHNQVNIAFEKKEPLFQSHILIGFLTSYFAEEDRYALKLLSSCLSGQGGRLFIELRDKQSLAYTVAPMSTDTPERSLFGFYIGCGPEKLVASIHGIRIELDKILSTPIPAKELERAKKYWTGRFELEMQRFSSQAMLFGLDELYGLGYEHSSKVPNKIKSVTSQDILKVAQKYLKPENATISIVHSHDVDEAFIRQSWDRGHGTIKPSKNVLSVTRTKDLS